MSRKNLIWAWIMIIWLIIIPILQIIEDYNQKKALCSNLYSKTVNYEACMNKIFRDTVKLVRPVDTEVGL